MWLTKLIKKALQRAFFFFEDRFQGFYFAAKGLKPAYFSFILHKIESCPAEFRKNTDSFIFSAF
jgi:hypothetical protein